MTQSPTPSPLDDCRAVIPAEGHARRVKALRQEILTIVEEVIASGVFH
ncbi:hypothetical protein [Streptomyces californicus]